jgi:hypothetical protein
MLSVSLVVKEASFFILLLYNKPRDIATFLPDGLRHYDEMQKREKPVFRLPGGLPDIKNGKTSDRAHAIAIFGLFRMEPSVPEDQIFSVLTMKISARLC